MVSNCHYLPHRSLKIDHLEAFWQHCSIELLRLVLIGSDTSGSADSTSPVLVNIRVFCDLEALNLTTNVMHDCVFDRACTVWNSVLATHIVFPLKCVPVLRTSRLPGVFTTSPSKLPGRRDI
jgi:hypothetical protein